MAFGHLENGIWIYGEDDDEDTHSEMLNIGARHMAKFAGDLREDLESYVETHAIPGPEGPEGRPGIPGVNAVANDTATAAYVEAPDSETHGALTSLLMPQHTGGNPAVYPVTTASGSLLSARGTPTNVTLPYMAGYTHLAFPAMCKIAGGHLVAARASSGHFATDGKIALIKTLDGGLTWSNWSVFTPANGTPGTGDKRDPGLVRLANGTLLLTWYDGGPKRTYYARSTDDGATWTPPALFAFGWTGDQHVGTMPVQLPNGTILVACYGGNTGAARTSVRVMRSTDNGVTWTGPHTLIDTAAEAEGANETTLIPLGGLKVMALLRRDRLWTYQTISTDGGLTWPPPAKAFMATGRLDAIRLASGVIIVVHRSTENGMGRHLTASKNTAAMIRTTRNDGVQWSPALEYLMWRGTTYSAMAETEPNSALTVTAIEESLNTTSALVAGYIADGSAVTKLGPVPSDFAPRPSIAVQGIELRLGGDVTLPADSYTIVPWGAIDADDWNGYALTPGASRFTVNETGYYLINITAQFDLEQGGAIGVLPAGMEPHTNNFIAYALNKGPNSLVDLDKGRWLVAGTEYEIAVYNLATTPQLLRSGAAAHRTRASIIKLKGVTG